MAPFVFVSIPHPNQCQWLGPRVGPLEKSVLIVPRHVAAIPEGRSGSRLPAVLSVLMFCQNPSSCPSADATSQPLSLWPIHLFFFFFNYYYSPAINLIPRSVSSSITFQSARRGGIFSVLIFCLSRIAVTKVQTQCARSGPSGLSVPVSSSGPHPCQGADKLSVAPAPSPPTPVCPFQFHRQTAIVVKVQTNFQSGPSSLSVAVSSSKRYRCQGADKLSVGPLQSVRSDFIVRPSSLSRCRQTFSRASPVCQFQFYRPTVIAVKVQTQIPLDPTPCPFLFRRQLLSLSGPRPNFHQN